jgi:hypothetical protein
MLIIMMLGKQPHSASICTVHITSYPLSSSEFECCCTVTKIGSRCRSML